MIKTLIIALFISSQSFGNFVEFPKLYTRAEMKRLSKIEFKQIISEAKAALPLKKDYPAQKAGEVAIIHHEWKDIGAALHEIAQIIKINKAHSSEGLSFLKRCAQNTNVRTEFAAICLTHYTVFNRTYRKIKINSKDFPQEVVNLSSFITD